jgi:hypothetical protein
MEDYGFPEGIAWISTEKYKGDKKGTKHNELSVPDPGLGSCSCVAS